MTKTKWYLMATGMFLAGSTLLTSCVQKNYYNTNPNNNNSNSNNNNNNTSYAYTFDEEFNGSDKYGWTFTDATDSAYASITNGSYQYVDYSTTLTNLSAVPTSLNVNSNFTVQTKIESNNVMGLIFGASSSDNGYAFYVDTAGRYSLYKEGASGAVATAVVHWTTSASVVKNSWNTLEVDVVGSTMVGYINSTQVFSVGAGTLAGPNFGFKILPGTIGYADYLLVKGSQL